MKVAANDKETFLYLNGIRVTKAVTLRPNVILSPATCSPDPDDIIAISKNEIDLGIAAIFLRRIGAQLHITADSAKALVTQTWNAQWDLLILTAFLDAEIGWNLQSDKPAERFSRNSRLNVPNYMFLGLTNEDRVLTVEEFVWLETFSGKAYSMLNEPGFQNAVHCLANYRWHTVPRIQLSVVWAGIEGLFGVESEIVFRLSLYVARFLEPGNDRDEQRQALFEHVKDLYKVRSRAVHGAQMKGESGKNVQDAVQLLHRLILECVRRGSLPNTKKLAP